LSRRALQKNINEYENSIRNNSCGGGRLGHGRG
jgi:hypothetical protein